MHEVLLVGAFGQANPGDEALLAAFCSAIGPRQVVVTSATPAETRQRFGCAAIAPTGPAVLRTLRHADHLVVGGGTIFKTLHRSSGRRPLSLLVRADALLRAARARSVTVSLVGVGAADLPSPIARRLARAVAHHSDLLVVRDEESASILASAGVATPLRVGADAAWTLLDELRNRQGTTSTERRGTLVALSHLAGGDDLADRLAATLDQLDPDLDPHPIHLQPWQTDPAGHDHHLAHAIAARLGSRVQVIDPPADLADAAAVAAGHGLVVGLRFHALVAAAATGTPFVALTHEPKLAGLARRFSQLAVPAHSSPAVVARAISLGRGQDPPARHIAEQEAARAAEGFRLLRLVLSAGATADDDLPRAQLALSTGGLDW
jgi:polysaccharide pyruvyl transferase WcaK-like protein